MMKHVFLLTVMLLLSGCFGGGSEVPQDNFYRLADITSVRQFTSPFQVVAVATFKSDALHRERAILYSDVRQPLNIKRYHYHHWTQVPNELVQDHLIEYLRKAEFSPRVVRYGEVVNIDAKITGYIKRFERLIDAGDAKVQVRLELHLETLGQARDHYQWSYDIEQATADTSMHASVTALSMALDNIYQQFLADLSKQELAKLK